MKDYNSAPPFSSFLPGIAGVFGCPLWVFYVNRGQAIAAFGVTDKNGALLEFRPADQAYRLTATHGFRTFIKVDGKYYEPFRGAPEMDIQPHGLVITETNKQLKLKVTVEYFTIPNESFPALARIVNVTNLSNKPKKLEVIDGLPIIVPAGFGDDLLKKMSQTISAWCQVENLENGAPFYRLKVAPADAAETKPIAAGNFFVSYSSQGQRHIIVDPRLVFGEAAGVETPAAFLKNKTFKLPARQQTAGFLPSAFSFTATRLPGRGALEICSVFGQAESLGKLEAVKKRLSVRAYLKEKEIENRALIDGISGLMQTESSSGNFDLYCRQTFLDNVMRGGLPVTFGGKNLYLYYRKHGDLERDYNDFRLLPTYFSQGNGNYRDTNQNRRNDIFFNPAVGADNITRFFNLLQLDGYNPLILQPTRFTTPEHPKPFILGEYLLDLEQRGFNFKPSREEFVSQLLAKATVVEKADHGEGFWIDHFSYNTDLLESFEAIYPDKINGLLFNDKNFTFYTSDHRVADRSEKYRLVGNRVRQFDSVRPDLKTTNQAVDYRTTLAVKLICLIANKASSFDAEGIGLEMEAEKPDWYDALNGLPGLLGSSLSETLELKRLAIYLQERLKPEQALTLPVEIKVLLSEVFAALKTSEGLAYWETATTARENFRRDTRLGLNGDEEVVEGKIIKNFLKAVIDKCSQAVSLVLEKHKDYYTYFINEVTEHVVVDGAIKVKKFSQRPLPLFLEGFVHALKVEQDKNIPARVKQGQLYDKKLKMYKVNAPLDAAPLEIGRARIFTPGWLENESIWLHMEYKYLLELLKAGFYRDFFADLKNTLIPFLNPKTYGRSILENSSFIVSSAHPDKTKHGRGFYARLSGASAEFVDMWLIMTTGKKIFSLDENGQLVFRLAPILPGWLFKRGRFSFKLLGSIDIIYLNPKGRDTFGGGVKAVSYKLTLDDGTELEINAGSIAEPQASLIRERKVKKIVVTLA